MKHFHPKHCGTGSLRSAGGKTTKCSASSPVDVNVPSSSPALRESRLTPTLVGASVHPDLLAVHILRLTAVILASAIVHEDYIVGMQRCSMRIPVSASVDPNSALMGNGLTGIHAHANVPVVEAVHLVNIGIGINVGATAHTAPVPMDSSWTLDHVSVNAGKLIDV